MKSQYEIRTPEWATIELRIAGVGLRALAALIDVGLIGAVDALLVLLISWQSARTPAQLLARGGAHVPVLYIIGGLFVIMFFFTVFYFVLWESLGRGQTPGKRALHLRVVSTEGRRVTFFSALVRNLVRIVDFLPSGYLIGLVTMLITPQEQRLGDLAAGTVVIVEGPAFRAKTRLPRRGRRARVAQTWREPVTPLPPAVQLLAQSLTPQDHELLQSFMARVHELRPDRAHILAEQIIQHFGAHLPAAAASCRDYIESTPSPMVLRALFQATQLEQLD